MVISSKKSKNRVVHALNCPYAQAISETNRKYIGSFAEAIKKGYRLCDHCSPVVEKLKENSQEVKRFCDHHELTVTHRDGVILVTSRYDKWKIVMNGKWNSLFLYHKDTEEKEEKDRFPDLVPGYHSQLARCNKTVVDYLNYIAGHDEYRDAKKELYVSDDEEKTAIYIPISFVQKYSDPRNFTQGYTKVKGTKKYRKKIAREKRMKRKDGIRTVYSLFDEIEADRD